MGWKTCTAASHNAAVKIFVLSDPLMHAPLFTAPAQLPRFTSNSIDNGHNRSIHRHCISSKSLSCRTAADSQHLFSDTGTDYICSHKSIAFLSSGTVDFPVRPSVSGPLSPLPSSSPIHDRQLYISAFRAPFQTVQLLGLHPCLKINTSKTILFRLLSNNFNTFLLKQIPGRRCNDGIGCQTDCRIPAVN